MNKSSGTFIPSVNSIVSFMHCAKCLSEKPPDVSQMDWSRTQTGLTRIGLQVWCNRHKCNVVHIDFQGQKHPANMGVEEGTPETDRGAQGSDAASPDRSDIVSGTPGSPTKTQASAFTRTLQEDRENALKRSALKHNKGGA